MGRLEHSLAHASGGGKGCHFIAYRYEGDAFRPKTGESLVGEGDTGSGSAYGLIRKPGWLTGLWQSENGIVYVTDVASRMYVKRDASDRMAPWEHERLEGTLAGVWGLDDENVWIWGQHRMQPVLYRWDGQTWHSQEAPGFIVRMHGLAPDLVVAVGRDGLIARWDGGRWRPMSAETPESLSGICIVSEDQMYACGSSGELFEGSIHGWSRVLRHSGMLHCVAHAFGAVWVGAGPDGLFKLDGKELTCVKPKVRAESFDWRDGLLVSCPDKITHSADGERFLGFALGAVATIFSAKPPSWREERAYRDPDDHDTD